MSVVLWPRQEILQLAIPQIGNSARPLNQALAAECVLRLLESRSVGGKISLPSWIAVGRSVLRWSDPSIFLFWDMLLLAVHYLNTDMSGSKRREEVEVPLECLAIFLNLHISEQTPPVAKQPSTPSSSNNYDSVWPLNAEGEVHPSSPVMSPSSPVRDVSARHRALSPIGSPRSPRTISPQAGHSPSKRLSPSSPRTPRLPTQHLHSVRHKIPMFLRILSWCRNLNGREDLQQFIGDSSRQSSSDSSFELDRSTADFLGMVICGGYSRDQCVSSIGSLHPSWAGEDSSGHFGQHARVVSSDFCAWIDQHLSMNDVLYPVMLAPSTPNVGTGMGVMDSLDPVTKDIRSQVPHKVQVALMSISRFTPTVINNCTTTVLHCVASGPSRTASFRHRTASRSNHDVTEFGARLASQSHDTSLSDTELESVSHDLGIPTDVLMEQDPVCSSPMTSPPWKMRTDDSDEDAHPLSRPGSSHGLLSGNLSKPELALPQLFINFSRNARLYMLGPYYSASISGCVDAHIVVGAVFGALILNGCEKVKITAACKKLIVINCLECEFNIATLSPTVVMGDSRSLSFGPHNAPYRSLRTHLRAAHLSELDHQFACDDGMDSSVMSCSNVWSQVCDLGTCVETPTRLLSSDFQGSVGFRFPLPSSSTALIQTPDQFRIVSIPVKAEFIGFQSSPISSPPTYKDHVTGESERIDEIKHRLAKLLAESDNPDSLTADDITVRMLTSSTVARRFMEWLVSSDNVQEIMDLIRLDGDRVGALTYH